MSRKLYAFKDGRCAEEGADNPMMHEVMLGGHLYLALLKERCEVWLRTLRIEMEKLVKQRDDTPVDVTTDSVVNRYVLLSIHRCDYIDISTEFELDEEFALSLIFIFINPRHFDLLFFFDLLFTLSL